jgi:hypothetical protein
MQLFDNTVKEILSDRLQELESHFGADVVFYYGEVHPALAKLFRDFIEKLAQEKNKKDMLVVFLNTPGGSTETVEKMVDIIRFHYQKVAFVIPDYAMSAGTIFSMSGNLIFMDYSSSLGPIDPQVFNGKEWVPALGYLDQVEKMLEKAKAGTITQAEFLILQSLDLAMLSRYEQTKNLTVTLLKKWLVNYKFADWMTHGSAPTKIGKPVTLQEKEVRAEEIARMLGDNKLWHSHGRLIGVDTLKDTLKLKVEDYSKDIPLRTLIRAYNDLLIEYIARGNHKIFLHSRIYF